MGLSLAYRTCVCIGHGLPGTAQFHGATAEHVLDRGNDEFNGDMNGEIGDIDTVSGWWIEPL